MILGWQEAAGTWGRSTLCRLLGQLHLILSTISGRHYRPHLGDGENLGSKKFGSIAESPELLLSSPLFCCPKALMPSGGHPIKEGDKTLLKMSPAIASTYEHVTHKHPLPALLSASGDAWVLFFLFLSWPLTPGKPFFPAVVLV